MTHRQTRTREKISALIWTVLIFSACSSFCLLISQEREQSSIQKHMVVKKAQRQQEFCDKQYEYLPLCDSLFARINRFDPGVCSSFEESDIKFLINDLRSVYEQHPWDKRYKVFQQTAAYYEMWFADKKILWSKKNNVRNFSQNLELCEMGLAGKEDYLKSKQVY